MESLKSHEIILIGFRDWVFAAALSHRFTQMKW